MVYINLPTLTPISALTWGYFIVYLIHLFISSFHTNIWSLICRRRKYMITFWAEYPSLNSKVNSITIYYIDVYFSCKCFWFFSAGFPYHLPFVCRSFLFGVCLYITTPFTAFKVQKMFQWGVCLDRRQMDQGINMSLCCWWWWYFMFAR